LNKKVIQSILLFKFRPVLPHLIESFFSALKWSFVFVPGFFEENLQHPVLEPVTEPVHAISVHQHFRCHAENEFIGTRCFIVLDVIGFIA
jgi:hypothetical protein